MEGSMAKQGVDSTVDASVEKMIELFTVKNGDLSVMIIEGKPPAHMTAIF